ncbi:MAG: ABC-F family ATP-binding cassette domain-containing protein [Lachnospiraceae bacterium]|nr:ABC-F family ATP-binding cassette domain-containing protein [Lachnospiraceae bacterium]
MIQIKNLNITHKKDLRLILQDFSLVLNSGDKAVIIGEEGNGKSTLLKWIYDPELVEDYAEAGGQRIFSGERLSYLPQELPEADRARTLYEFFAQEPAFFEQTPRELGALAGGFHLPPDFFYGDQPMGTLSGGEKVKAQLMRLMMSRPTALLLDEPSNDLDIGTLEWLEEMILNWQGTVLYISHDETLIERTANTVIHIEQIRRKTLSRYTVAHMPYLQYRKERGDKFEKQARQAAGERREKEIRDEKLQRIQQSVAYHQETITRQNPSKGRLLKKKMKAVKSLEHRFERQDAEMTRMPEEEDAIFFKLGDQDAAVPAGKTVIEYTLPCLRTPDHGRILARDISLRIRGSEKIGIIGDNGAGKTTLLRLMAEDLLARRDIRAAYMPQNYEELLDLASTPVDYLSETGDKEELTRIRTFLGSLKYTFDEMDHPISQLSGGQKAKVLLLKMSLSGANVLILDEPTRNFSALSAPVIRQMIARFPGAVLSISHDRKYLREVCHKVYRLTEQGLSEDFSFSDQN